MLARFGRRRISDSILWIAPVQSLVRIASKRSAAGFQKYVFQPTTKRSPTTPTLPPTADSKRPLDGFGTHIGPGQMLDILGEESGHRGARSGARTWLLDPLCGTSSVESPVM